MAGGKGAGVSAERWRTLPGWSYFEVSDQGRVRRLAGTPKCKDGRLLRCTVNDRGYLVAHLRQDGREKQMLVHQAVLIAFVGPAPSALHEGAHGDGIRTNAALSNLRWATHAENEADKVLHGTRIEGETHPSSTKSDIEAAEILRLRELGLSFSEISGSVGYSKAHACRIANGQRRKAVLEKFGGRP
jgi:hypothetical protein